MSTKIKELEFRLRSLGSSDQSPLRVDLLNQLAWEIGYDDTRHALDSTLKAKELATRISYPLGVAQSNRNLGFYYYSRADFDQALRFSYEALDVFVQLNKKDEEGKVLGIIGLIYWSLGNFDLALDYLNKSEQALIETGTREQLPWTLNTLGGIHEELGDYDKALAYHQRSLELFRRSGDRLGEGRALSGIGKVYEDRREYERALDFHKQSLDLYREIGSKNGEARALNDIGSVHHKLGNLKEALKFHRKSLTLRRQVGNKGAEVTSLLNIGKVFNQLQQPKRALGVLTKAQKIAEEIYANPKLYQAHQALAEAYEMLGDLQPALDHLKAYHRVREQVFNDETNTRLKNLQIQFEVEKSQKEAEIHRLKNIELKQALNKLKQANRELRETQVQLVQSEKMATLGQLTAGIAHEINNPIGALTSSADISVRCVQKIRETVPARSDDEKESDLRKMLDILEKNHSVILSGARRIADIVNNLKNFARLDEAEY